jgi:Xaa-Pro aminopeptidase
MFTQEIYSARRRQLKATGGKGLILLLANEESSMNYTDNLYHFRQDN